MMVRPATAADIEAVHRIATENSTAPQWSAAQFAETLQHPPGSAVERALLVADDGGTLTGFAVVAALTTVYPVQAELESIATLPGRHRQGIGTALLGAVFDWCARKDVAELALEVRVSNANAIRLYKRVGFRRDGIRPGYYQHPAEDAMCMICSHFPVEALPHQQ